MTRFIIQRVLDGILVIIAVLIIVFFLSRIGSDPVALYAPVGATQTQLDSIRSNLGLDKPLYLQLGDFLYRAAQGDFGQSVRYASSALALVIERLPASLMLTATALIITILIGIPAGIVAAIYRGKWIDKVVITATLIGQSLPTFWTAVMLIVIFGVNFGILPIFGFRSLSSLILPGLTLAAYSVSVITRTTRSTFIQTLQQDYVRTATAKGVPRTKVVLKHIMRNSMIPVITLLGLQVSSLIGGAIITEFIFSFPGIARLATQAVLNRDFPVVQAFVFVTAIGIILINTLVDLLYAVIDPRVRV